MAIEYTFDHPAESVYQLLTDWDFLSERLEAVGEDPPDIQLKKKGKKIDILYQRAARRDVPKVAAKVIGAVQAFSMRETWQPDGDGWSGDYLIEFSGVPASVAADFQLLPTETGCVYRITHKPKVSMPLIGKTLEKVLLSQVEDGCDEEIDYLATTLDG